MRRLAHEQQKFIHHPSLWARESQWNRMTQMYFHIYQIVVSMQPSVQSLVENSATTSMTDKMEVLVI